MHKLGASSYCVINHFAILNVELKIKCKTSLTIQEFWFTLDTS